MFSLDSVTKAIRAEGLAGWLFYNIKHRDPLSDRILGISPAAVNTRPFYCLIPAAGEPIKIVHTIEPEALDHLPGRTVAYSSRQELASVLTDAARSVRGGVCAQFSKLLPGVSCLDHGTALFLIECGFELTSSARCLQRVIGSLSPAQRESHRSAANHLYEIVSMAWKRAAKDLAENNPVTEGSIRDYMLAEIEKRELVTDHPPIVACGTNSSDPHYAAEGSGSRIERNTIIQFDIWAKHTGADDVYADISWVGYTAEAAPARLTDRFHLLTRARDLAVRYIREYTESGFPTGAEVDREVREFFQHHKLDSYLRHRTGHAIDTECHGFGANLDSVEFPEERKLIEGSCFSVEPGLYFGEYGMRTEIDVLIEDGRPVITGVNPQATLLTL